MTMAIKRPRPLIRVTQWFRRRRNKNYAFKQAEKEAKRFAREHRKRNRAAKNRAHKVSPKMVCFLLLAVAIGSAATHFLTKWGM